MHAVGSCKTSERMPKGSNPFLPAKYPCSTTDNAHGYGPCHTGSIPVRGAIWGRWCIGSTADCGSARTGSNPVLPTRICPDSLTGKNMGLLILRSGFESRSGCQHTNKQFFAEKNYNILTKHHFILDKLQYAVYNNIRTKDNETQKKVGVSPMQRYFRLKG